MPEPTTQQEREALDQMCPEHDRDSCSDEQPVNAGVDLRSGHTWCRRCEGLWRIEAKAGLAARSLPPTDAPRVREWMPIETAPEDGSYILLCNEHVSGSWVGKFQQFAVSGYRFEDPWRTMMLNHDHMPKATRYRQPTHWQPMPAALARHEGENKNG